MDVAVDAVTGTAAVASVAVETAAEAPAVVVEMAEAPVASS